MSDCGVNVGFGAKDAEAPNVQTEDQQPLH